MIPDESLGSSFYYFAVVGLLLILAIVADLICIIVAACIDSKKKSYTSSAYRTTKYIISTLTIVVSVILLFMVYESIQTGIILYAITAFLNIGSCVLVLLNRQMSDKEREYLERQKLLNSTTQTIIDENGQQKTIITQQPQTIQGDTKSQPMTIWQWIYTIILLAIPVVNIILCICWLCGVGNKSRRSFLWAYIIITIISSLIVFIFRASILTWLYSLLSKLIGG